MADADASARSADSEGNGGEGSRSDAAAVATVEEFEAAIAVPAGLEASSEAGGSDASTTVDAVQVDAVGCDRPFQSALRSELLTVIEIFMADVGLKERIELLQRAGFRGTWEHGS